jgi:hypothetical protein
MAMEEMAHSARCDQTIEQNNFHRDSNPATTSLAVKSFAKRQGTYTPHPGVEHNFLRFSPIFGEQIGAFLIYVLMLRSKFFQNLALF